jgi:hypothetical protein
MVNTKKEHHEEGTSQELEEMETAVRGGCKTSRCASGEKRESGRKDAQTRGHQEVRAEKGGL